MLKELLSDFYNITKPSYQPDSFTPYFSLILTVVAVTILAYGFQTVTTTIHAYADRPVSFQSTVVQKENCKKLTKDSLSYLCTGANKNSNTNYISKLSSEQDLHNPIK